MVTSVPLVSRNLHTNPSLETGSTGWFGQGTGTFTRANDDAYPGAGSWSAKMVTTGAAGSHSIWNNLMAATAGLEYSVRVPFKGTAGMTGCAIYFEFYNASNVVVTSVNSGVFTATGDWQVFTLSGICPATATQMRASYRNAVNQTAGKVARMDAIDYRIGPGDDNYLDGDQPGGMWEGTAHASTSVRVLSLSGPISGKRDSHLVTISEPGDDDPVRLPVNGIDCSWRVNRRGELSAEIETERLRAAGLLRCRGRWIRFAVPGMGAYGAWAGVIKKVRHDGDNGLTEVAAQTREALLDARRTAREYVVETADAGGLAAKMIADNAAEGSSFITADRIGVTPLVSVDIRAEQLVEGIDQLARAADAEWRVTHDNVFEFAERLGVDWGSAVTLLEGRDFTRRGWEVLEDLDPVVTDLLALSGVEAYTRKTAVVVINDDLAEEIGQRQGTKVYPYMIKENQLRPTAKAELAQLGRLGRGITLDVRNTERRNWTRFGEGDTVRVRLASAGVAGSLRVMVRTWSSTSNRLMVSGEWV